MIRSKRIFQYIIKFGLYHGLKIFFNVRRSKSDGELEFNIPNLKHKLFLRRGTSDFFVFEELFIEERYKIKTTDKIEYIIDAGANIGLAALYFHRSFPNAKIICLEPETTNFSLLERNTSLYPSIIKYNVGLWNKKCALKIINNEDASWAFRVEETFNTDNSNVHSLSVNDILLEHPTASIDLIKIDIEGSEMEVFEKNTEWLLKTKNILIELHENLKAGTTACVMKALTDFKYTRIFDNYLFKNNIN